MKKAVLHTFFFILLMFTVLDNYSQSGTIYFSTTGDTICYASVFGFELDSTHIGHTAYIKRSNKDGSAATISRFTISCEASNTCLETLSKDTVAKYHLKLDGSNSVWSQKNDFVISIKPTNTKVIDTSAFGPKFIYQTTVVVFISCKEQTLYENQFDIMFKGNDAKDFPERDIVRIQAWRKGNTKKYYVELDVKEFQTFKKPGDTPDYHFKSLQFML